MKKDSSWKSFFSDDERFADCINGYGCGGKQVLTGSDLQEMDSQTGYFPGTSPRNAFLPGKRSGKVKYRDLVRKAAFGMNFAIIGIENQECIDYTFPVRNMTYDSGEYEKQIAKMRKKMREERSLGNHGEYLYGFHKDSRLYPVVTFILYSGEEEWDGPRTLHEMLDFAGIPESLRSMVQDYQINLIEIRRLTDTSMFKTDLRQVFDFIRCSHDKKELKKLIESDPAFQNMEEDAFDVMVQYGKAAEMVGIKDEFRKDGRIDMCKGLADWIAEEREAGMEAGMEAGKEIGLREGDEVKTRRVIINMLNRGMSDEDIMAVAECDRTLIDEIRKDKK